MRRSIIFFLSLVSFQMALGQNKFQGGPMVGINVAKLSSEIENISGTARPFLGLYGQYIPINFLSVEINSAFSMRGERIDQTTVRGEVNFIDAHLLLKVHFLQAFSFGTGIGYYNALNGRVVNRLTTDILLKDGVADVSPFSQTVLPLEVGFQFHNEATLHFTYGYALFGGFNNPAITFRFPIRVKSKADKLPTRRVVAKNQIRRLDRGMLLVRLRTAQPLIDRLNESGAIEKADEVVRKVEEENRKIIHAFNAHYDFSELYFFYNSFSEDVKEGDFSSLMNADLDEISVTVNDSVDFYIAEFTNLQPDTGRYYTDSSIEPDPNGGLRRVKRYGDYDIGADIQALVIKDRNYVQLRDPFPYYERSLVNSLSPTREALQRPNPIVTKDKHEKKYRFAVKNLNVRMKRFRKRAMTKDEKDKLKE